MMKMKTCATILALCVGLAPFAAVAQAENVHTITPHFPDHFKIRTTQVTEQLQENSAMAGAQAKTQTNSTVVVTGKLDKTPQGYHASYAVESFNVSVTGPDGTPSPQATQLLEIVKMIKDAGPAEVTLDPMLYPVSVDNIEEIKTKAKQALTTAPQFKDHNVGLMIYNMMLAQLTPETAADFLKMSKPQGSFFNRPLTVGEAIDIGGEPITIMGGSFRMNGNMTLADWEEGKTAHLVYVMSPNEDDMHSFLSGMMKNMMGNMMPQVEAGSKDAESLKTVQAMIDRMADNMKMNIAMTCKIDLSLVNTIDTHMECDTDTTMVMDMKKIVPAVMMKDKPEQADALPVITVKQKVHQVSDSIVID